MWHRFAGSSLSRVASDPANRQPHAADQPADVLTRPECDNLCHLPEGLAIKRHSVKGFASTTAADLASLRAASRSGRGRWTRVGALGKGAMFEDEDEGDKEGKAAG